MTWAKPGSVPGEHAGLNRVSPKAGAEIFPCDFTPKWHRQTGKLLGTGATFWYDTKKNSIIEHSESETCYSVHDPEQRTWSQWQTLSMPDKPRFEYDRADTQRYDLRTRSRQHPEDCGLDGLGFLCQMKRTRGIAYRISGIGFASCSTNHQQSMSDAQGRPTDIIRSILRRICGRNACPLLTLSGRCQ
ncbi:MAG: sialidase [Planctomycetaceae bacterium]|nr:sialidase [Planctomycetaceae bacterium]